METQIKVFVKTTQLHLIETTSGPKNWSVTPVDDYSEITLALSKVQMWQRMQLPENERAVQKNLLFG
jgi:hypothetical protein